jgi:hypothetical protein
MDRIIECVPRFLSDEKRFFILKNEVIYFIQTLHQKQQNKNASLSELNTLFENYATQIEKFNQSNLPYMVGKRIFKPEEIEQFLLVCKYALIEKLNLAYRQVQSDLVLIKSKLSDFKTGIFKANYQIDFLNSKIDISHINETEVSFIQLKKQEVNLDGTYKQFAEQYILEEFMQMNFSQKEGEVNHFVKSKDLDFFISQYNEINDSESEATLKSEFRGEGGQLNLTLEIKSLKKIQSLIYFSGVKLLLYSAIFIGAIVVIFTFELYKVILLLIFGGLIVGVFLLEGFKTEIKTIKDLKLDLKRYGK